MTRMRTRTAPLLWTAALIIGLLMPFVISDFDLFDLTRLLCIAMAVAGLNLLMGHSGQVSVGHGAIFGIGGYSALITAATLGWPWWAGVAAAAVASLAFGILLGVPALKMGGGNLGMLTIAVAAIFPLLVIRLEPITGGTVGIYLARSAITAPEWTGLTGAQFEFLMCLGALAVTLILLRNLVTGRMGRALAAVRTSPLLAAANGVNVNRVKLMAFAVSSTVAGIAGALYALVLALAVPDSYLITFSITLLTASVVGGSRTWAGALIGAAIVVYLPTLAEAVVGGQAAGNWSQLIYAIGLAICLIFAPQGLAGAFRSLAEKIRKRAPGDPLRTASDPSVPPAERHPSATVNASSPTHREEVQ
jgi:branched-chain amino acid transport system permease protein